MPASAASRRASSGLVTWMRPRRFAQDRDGINGVVERADGGGEGHVAQVLLADLVQRGVGRGEGVVHGPLDLGGSGLEGRDGQHLVELGGAVLERRRFFPAGRRFPVLRPWRKRAAARGGRRERGRDFIENGKTTAAANKTPSAAGARLRVVEICRASGFPSFPSRTWARRETHAESRVIGKQVRVRALTRTDPVRLRLDQFRATDGSVTENIDDGNRKSRGPQGVLFLDFSFLADDLPFSATAERRNRGAETLRVKAPPQRIPAAFIGAFHGSDHSAAPWFTETSPATPPCNSPPVAARPWPGRPVRAAVIASPWRCTFSRIQPSRPPYCPAANSPRRPGRSASARR